MFIIWYTVDLVCSRPVLILTILYIYCLKSRLYPYAVIPIDGINRSKAQKVEKLVPSLCGIIAK